MKILFVCNSLEEGKDGIGDYTKRIALQCNVYEIEAILVSFNDKYISEVESGRLGVVPFYRIPDHLSLIQKESEFGAIIKENGPIDWVSLQFVSYGLNKRGIIWAEIQPFRRMFKPYKVHVMMHELWIGEEFQASWKAKLMGWIQKRFIISLLKTLKPNVIQSSIPLYKKMLDKSGIRSSILPLFSNINNHFTKVEDFKSKVPQSIFDRREQYHMGCLFGSIYFDSWDMTSLFKALLRGKKKSGKKILIASIGKISYGEAFWESLPVLYPDIEFLTLGQQDELFVSYWLNHFVNFGIVTTPAIIAGKSGSYMAFLEHGLPVVCKRNELSFNFDISGDIIDQRIIQIDETSEIETWHREPLISQMKNTLQQFVQTLKES